jgi:hypothetical protein
MSRLDCLVQEMRDGLDSARQDSGGWWHAPSSATPGSSGRPSRARPGSTGRPSSSALCSAGATFQDAAWFDRATFGRLAEFGEATFQGHAGFDKAHVLHLDRLDTVRVWPDGWTVYPDPTDPSRGTLVKG